MENRFITLSQRASNGLYNDVACNIKYQGGAVRIGDRIKIYYDAVDNVYKVYSPVVLEQEPGGMEEVTIIYYNGRYDYVQETPDQIIALLVVCCQNDNVVSSSFNISLSLNQVNCELVQGYALDLYLKTDNDLPIGTKIQIGVANAVNIPMAFSLSALPACNGLTVDGSNLVVVSPSSISNQNGCLFRIFVATGSCTKKTFNISIVTIDPSVEFQASALTVIYNPPTEE